MKNFSKIHLLMLSTLSDFYIFLRKNKIKIYYMCTELSSSKTMKGYKYINNTIVQLALLIKQ